MNSRQENALIFVLWGSGTLNGVLMGLLVQWRPGEWYAVVFGAALLAFFVTFFAILATSTLFDRFTEQPPPR